MGREKNATRSRPRLLQPKWPALKTENAAETALLMTITGSNLIAEAAHAREPQRVWVGSSLFGMSAFRNLRSRAAGVHSHRLSYWNSILTCRLRASSNLYAIAPTRIVAAAESSGLLRRCLTQYGLAHFEPMPRNHTPARASSRDDVPEFDRATHHAPCE